MEYKNHQIKIKKILTLIFIFSGKLVTNAWLHTRRMANGMQQQLSQLMQKRALVW
jgi:hypothetical protein